MNTRTYYRPLAAVSVATLLLLSGCGGGGNGGGSFFAGVGVGGNTSNNSGSNSAGSGDSNSSSGDSGGSTAKFTIGGTISGLSAEGLALQNNGGDLLSVANGSTAFKFATALPSGTAYDVGFAAHPFGQVCFLNGQSGNATADVVSIAIVCGDWTSVSAKVNLFAGSTTRGVQDGARLAAGFYGPYGLAFGPDGTMVVADSGNNTIRKITPAGVVSTLAGDSSLLNGGHADGAGTAASFKNPRGVIVDPNGITYVADHENNMIRKITPEGVVSVFAGQTAGGNVDGVGANAQFQFPWGIVMAASGNLFIADQGNNLIRKITPAGVVSTFAGNGSAGFVDANGTSAQFSFPTGLAIDAADNLYVSDQGNNVIRKITPAGLVSTFAGNGTAVSGDGTGTSASFARPVGIAIDGDGNIYVTDLDTNSIRKISPDRTVTTLAGGDINGGNVDGRGNDARFNQPMGVGVDRSGDVFVADRSNNTIRKITRTDAVSPPP